MDIVGLANDEKQKFFMDVIRWDNQKLAIESQNKFKQYLNTGEGCHFADCFFLGQIFLLNNNKSSFFQDYDKYKGDFNKLLQISAPSMFQNYIFNGKKFTMTKPVYDLLEKTNNKIFLRKHPFIVFSIDQKVMTEYAGLNILFSMFFEVGNEHECNGCNYLIFGRDERDDTEFWLTGGIGTIKDSHLESKSWKKEELKELHTQVGLLYANFLDYLNHPYAKQRFFEKSWNNEKRIQRGQFPIQDKIEVSIKPQFIEDILKQEKNNGDIKYSHKFWVRGHFMHFRNRKRYNKIYQLSNLEANKRELFYSGEYLSKWIKPCIKGKGKLQERSWKLT